MLTETQKADTLKRRLAPLVLTEEQLAEVAADVKRNARYIRSLYQEWLADVTTYEQNEYTPAIRDPNTHFRRWLDARIKEPYHISDLILRIVRRRYNIDFTTKFYMIVWWQEIAWAQRHRLSDNAFIASKAGFFLAKAESDSKEVFLQMADLYADASMTAEYRNSSFQDLAPDQIRYSDALPDFTPLFLDYTNKFLADKLSTLSPQQINQTAQAAARKEKTERLKAMTERAIAHAERFPMCQDLSLIRIAINQRLSSNELFLLEKAYLEKLRDGSAEITPGSITPKTAFVTMLADKTALKGLLKEAQTLYAHRYPVPDVWQIVGYQRKWLDDLPQSFEYVTNLMQKLGSWQTDLVEETRPMPFDPISDFGFYVLELERRV